MQNNRQRHDSPGHLSTQDCLQRSGHQNLNCCIVRCISTRVAFQKDFATATEAGHLKPIESPTTLLLSMSESYTAQPGKEQAKQMHVDIHRPYFILQYTQRVGDHEAWHVLEHWDVKFSFTIRALEIPTTTPMLPSVKL